MFSNSKPVPFDPYGRRRKRRLMPPWLALLIAGVVVGGVGVVYVQERHLPPRLSADASARLRESFEQADAERSRLKAELADATRRLERADAENKTLVAQLSARTESVQQLRADVAALVAALPPDPRGGPVAVRAAHFEVGRGTLAYDVVLSRDRGGSPLGGVVQFVVAGSSDKGTADTVTLKPVPVSIDRYDSVRGSQPLPQGFKPRQTTIHVLDRVGGKLLGMRVINVN